MWSDCCCYILSATPHAKTCACVCARTPTSIDFWLSPTAAIRPAPLLHWLARSRRMDHARSARKLASAYELAHCSTLAPRSAQKKLKLASPQKPSSSMQKIEHLLIRRLSRSPSQGVSFWVHTTEPEGSPRCAPSSTSHSGWSTVYTSELLCSQSRSSEGKPRSSRCQTLEHTTSNF